MRVQWECFWVNLRDENKVSQFNMEEFIDGCHHLFQHHWISLSQSFVQNGWFQDGRIQDGWESSRWVCHESSLNQIELVWVRVRVEGECFGVNLREDKTWCLNPRWQCLNPTWQNSRWLPSSSWVRMNKFESDKISLSQNESGVRVFLSESERRKQGVSIQHGRIQDRLPSSSWVRMNEWSFLFQHGRITRWLPSSSWVRKNEWSFFFVQMVGTNLGKCEWVWEEKLIWLNPRWPNSRWENSRWLPSSSWIRL